MNYECTRGPNAGKTDIGYSSFRDQIMDSWHSRGFLYESLKYEGRPFLYIQLPGAKKLPGLARILGNLSISQSRTSH